MKNVIIIGSCTFIILSITLLQSLALAAQDGGYSITPELWAKAILRTSTKDVTLVWSEVGTDITPSGAQVVSGYFYADPDDFAYGSQYNPEVFVKVYIDPSGWANIAFNHVTVDDVNIYSAHRYRGVVDNNGTISLSNRLAEHQYTGVLISSSNGTEPVITDVALYKFVNGVKVESVYFSIGDTASITVETYDPEKDVKKIIIDEFYPGNNSSTANNTITINTPSTPTPYGSFMPLDTFVVEPPTGDYKMEIYLIDSKDNMSEKWTIYYKID